MTPKLNWTSWSVQLQTTAENTNPHGGQEKLVGVDSRTGEAKHKTILWETLLDYTKDFRLVQRFSLQQDNRHKDYGMQG